MSDEQEHWVERAPPLYRREIAWGSVFSGAALALSLGGAGIGAYVSLQRDIADLRTLVANNSLLVVEQAKSCAAQAVAVTAIDRAVRNLERDVTRIETRVNNPHGNEQ